MVILFVYYFSEKSTVHYIALLSSIIFFCFDYYRRHLNPAFNEYFINSLSWLLRTHEYYDRPVGAAFYLFGVSIVISMTRVEDIIYLSILNLSFCDPVASMVGGSVKSIKITENKTLAGSAAAAVTGIVVAACYAGFFGANVNLLAAGTIALISELVVVPGVDDNLTIPAVSCVLWKFYYQDIVY
eukprot:CAMPEP_0204896304 /NCGR_PEP_ID=MMETSP1397-20131031/84_1 /ASSEMBLY_ACC=CAM_ASM_000891 /TAXON_ID=49980 /ORGANISM="Climacostomum Climacostomum virens, Strain Stock W-24" /LENGTH=184 /DNA_ID=CAMNT_0052063897 /DNA_START=718 /DNA_END=1272 /DNA_ORIENTATION=-